MSAMVSESVRRLNPGVFGGPAQEQKTKNSPVAQIARRTRADGVNKSERDFMRVIEQMHAESEYVVLTQPPRLFELAGGGTYTPDYLVVTPGGAVVYEVKGGYGGPGAEQGVERFKRAAAQWDSPVLVFVLAVRDKSAAGGWRLEAWRERVTLREA